MNEYGAPVDNAWGKTKWSCPCSCNEGCTIFNLCTKWRWVANLIHWPLEPLGKSPWYTLNRRLGGCQSLSGHFGRESLALPGVGTLDCPAHSVVTMSTVNYTILAPGKTLVLGGTPVPVPGHQLISCVTGKPCWCQEWTNTPCPHLTFQQDTLRMQDTLTNGW